MNQEFYDNDVSRAWILILIDEFYKVRDTAPALSKLKLPNFSIRHDLTRTLGSWNQDTRTLAISEFVIQHGCWDDVLEVLKHEMAHQVVSELFHLNGTQPHGEEFARACKILNISPTASHRLTCQGKSGLNSILSKIRKLLALGESSNKFEAQLALAKAHELSVKHNIGMSQSRLEPHYGLRPLGPLFKRVPSYIWGITKILEGFYFIQYICRPIRSRCPETKNETYKIIEIYGTKENLEMAEYVYYFLLHSGEMNWRIHREQLKLRNNKLKLSFLQGLYNGFYCQLQKQREIIVAEKSLIWLGDPNLDAFFSTRNPRVRRVNHYTKRDLDTHRAGLQTGENLRIRLGLRKTNRRSLKLLEN